MQENQKIMYMPFRMLSTAIIVLCVILLVLAAVGCKKDSLPTETNNKGTVKSNRDTSMDFHSIVVMNRSQDESYKRYLIAVKILSDNNIEYDAFGNSSTKIYVSKSDTARAVELLKRSKELEGYLFWP